MILLHKTKHAISNPSPAILAVLLTLLLVASIATVADDSASIKDYEIIIDNLAFGFSSGWTSKSFKGMTEYTWVKEGEKNFMVFFT